MFNAPKLTNDGKELYYDNMAGTQIVFTTIQLGSGNISGPIAPMTALVTPVVTINAEAKSVSGQYAEISGHFSNAQLADGFYFREIGVFAADPDYPNDRGKDILYCYQNAYDTADFIPVASVETVEKNITIPVIIGDTAAVSCTLSRSLILASMEDLDNHNKNKNAHEDIRQALTKKQEKITVNGLLKGDGKGGISAQKFDTKPTKDSGNLLTSGAVATAMDVAAALTSAAEYSAAATYAVGAYCTKGSKLYRCTVAIPQAEAWNAAHWTATTMGAELVAIYTTLANKAPGGYGLGNISGRTANGFSEITGYGFYRIPSESGFAPDASSNWGAVYIGANLSYGTLLYARNNALMAVRSVSEGKVGPIEWVNPPMAVGVEYRTVERFQGKPVYVKTINMGNLPGNAVKQANFQSNNVVDKIVSVTGQCTSDSGVGISMPYHTGSGPNLETVIYIGAATIGKTQIVTFLRDYSGYKDASITVKYTKLAD